MSKDILIKCAKSYLYDHHDAIDGHPSPECLLNECKIIEKAISELEAVFKEQNEK